MHVTTTNSHTVPEPLRPHPRRWYASTGWWALALAGVHVATTGVFYTDSLQELTSGPLIGALDADAANPAARGAAFWYVSGGVLLAGFGWSTWREEAAGRPPSGGFALGLGALGLAGVVVSPLSGFWGMLAIGVVAGCRRFGRITGTGERRSVPSPSGGAAR